MGDGFYRSKDPTNSIKVLKEQKEYSTQITQKYNKHTYEHKNTAHPLVYRSRQKSKPLEKIRYLRNCSKFFHQIHRAYKGGLRPHILQIPLQYLVAFKNYIRYDTIVEFNVDSKAEYTA